MKGEEKGGRESREEEQRKFTKRHSAVCVSENSSGKVSGEDVSAWATGTGRIWLLSCVWGGRGPERNIVFVRCKRDGQEMVSDVADANKAVRWKAETRTRDT